MEHTKNILIRQTTNLFTDSEKSQIELSLNSKNIEVIFLDSNEPTNSLHSLIEIFLNNTLITSLSVNAIYDFLKWLIKKVALQIKIKKPIMTQSDGIKAIENFQISTKVDGKKITLNFDKNVTDDEIDVYLKKFIEAKQESAGADQLFIVKNYAGEIELMTQTEFVDDIKNKKREKHDK